MAAILNGFLPLRKKDQHAQERILNTRWGDSGISAPIHGGWNTSATSSAEPSPELDQDLPPTPPQYAGDQDGVFIVRDDGPDSEDETLDSERENASITITLPWKKKQKQMTDKRRSITNITGPRYTHAQRMDFMPPTLATAEAAAIPLPESRVSSPINRDVISPVSRPTATSPVLSFRSRLASPSLGDMLSPVAEGFAKSGPSTRPTPVLSPLHYIQSVPLDRPPTASSLRPNGSRRSSLTRSNSGNVYAGRDDSAVEAVRPPSRGLSATAHMRASSREPRSNSTDPKQRRAASVEPIHTYAEQAQPRELVVPPANDHLPLRNRAPSVEPLLRRRAPSVEPTRRAPSIEPARRRAPSVEPANRRAVSREPRGRRGFSVEPARRRHHSEAPLKAARDSISSNDASADSESEKETSDCEWHRDFTSPRPRPRRRRSIASPMSSPTASSFIVQTQRPQPQQAQAVQMDSIAARAGLIRPQPVQRPPVRSRSKSNTRGLYGDMQDDFSMLARDVRQDLVPVKQSGNTVISPITSPQLGSASLSVNRIPSPTPSSDLTHQATGLAAAVAQRFDEPQGFSDSDACRNQADGHGEKMLLASLARERKDQLRREDRERAREKVVRRMERERERIAAMSTLSDCESVASGRTAVSAAEKTRRVYGTSSIAGYDSDASLRSWTGKSENKELVKNAEEIWG